MMGRTSMPGTLLADPRIRIETKYKSGEPGAVYEFNVKFHKRDYSADVDDDTMYIEVREAVDVFADLLRDQFPWVGEVYLTGRSGGWLAVEDKQGKATNKKIEQIADMVDDARVEFGKYLDEAYGKKSRNRRRNASEHSAMPDYKGWQIQLDPATDRILLVAPDGRETYNLANPESWDSYLRNSLFAFQFGAHGTTRVLIWEQRDHIDSALEEAGSWLEQHAPGHLSDLSDEYKEALEEARSELGEDADEEKLQERAQEIAETDMTYTEAGWITSWEWHVNELTRGELFDVALHASKRIAEEELEPNSSRRPAAYDPPDRKGTAASALPGGADMYTEGDFFFEYGIGHPMKMYRLERGRLVRLPFSRQESETVGAMGRTIAGVAADNGQHHAVIFEFKPDGDVRQVGNVLGNGDTARVVWSPSRAKNPARSRR